jgi:hypothetical protein
VKLIAFGDALPKRMRAGSLAEILLRRSAPSYWWPGER